jgi:hypothetical protein
MAKWQLGSIVIFLVIFGLTAILTGSAIFIVPAVILAALVFGYAGFNLAMTKRVEARHDSLDDAMSDENEPLPTSHLIPDDKTPAGDTPEAHDEINPHDLPPDHPGRHAAEEMAAGGDGPTSGMAAGGAAGDEGTEEGEGRREPTGEAKRGAEARET